SPAAGFVKGPAVTRTTPTQPKVNLQLPGQTDTLRVTGSVGRSVKGPDNTYYAPTEPTTLTSSLYIDGSISYGCLYERRKYNATLLGLPATSIDRSPWPSETVVDPFSPAGAATGTFTSPSWTHKSVGFNQAFVGVNLSSSYWHERQIH